VILILILITYDVSTQDAAGRKRLRKVAKECVNYGQRVQNSVFECVLDSSQLLIVKDKLLSMIDPKQDSLRFYNLGNKYQRKVEHFGVKASYGAEGTLIV
jgi:CRISPR-associated protein Cas2